MTHLARSVYGGRTVLRGRANGPVRSIAAPLKMGMAGSCPMQKAIGSRGGHDLDLLAASDHVALTTSPLAALTTASGLGCAWAWPARNGLGRPSHEPYWARRQPDLLDAIDRDHSRPGDGGDSVQDARRSPSAFIRSLFGPAGRTTGTEGPPRVQNRTALDKYQLLCDYRMVC